MTINIRRVLLAVAISAALLSPVAADARSSGKSSSYCASCPRDSHGRIARSRTVTQEFKRATGYPRGRPGYVVDHIVPLKRGGCDCASNLQWQSKADAKAKDRWE